MLPCASQVHADRSAVGQEAGAGDLEVAVARAGQLQCQQEWSHIKGFVFPFICTFYLSFEVVINVNIIADQLNCSYTTAPSVCPRRLSCVPQEEIPSLRPARSGRPGVLTPLGPQPLLCSTQ